jgi:ABC-type transport system involved in cytochrome c biogenesis permease subunit
LVPPAELIAYDQMIEALSDRDYFKGALFFYALATIYAVFLWRKGFREDDRISYTLLFVGFVLQSTAMALRGFSLSRCPVNNLYEAMLFIMWTLLAACLGFGAIKKLRFITAFASPVLLAIGVFALMPPLDRPDNVDRLSSGLGSLHAALILLAYGAFGLSCVAGIMYLTEEHDLKVRKLRAVLSRLPPIQRLELIIHRLLITGFLLLTAGLALSPLLMKQAHGIYLKPDAKVLWSVFVWSLYLGLLVLRYLQIQGGRKFAWGAVGSFSFVLLTFWGFNLLSTVHNP